MIGSAWTAGVVLGVLDAFLLFMSPPLALALLVAGAVLAVRQEPRTAGIAGLLVGVGGLLSFVLAGTAIVGTWGLALILLAVGVTLTLYPLALRRGRSPGA